MLLNRILRTTRPASLPSSLPTLTAPTRHISSSRILQQQTHSAATTKPNVHGAYYKTHGRALFKSLTLAFFSYQIFYWGWLTLEAETYKDEKNSVIQSLEGEVRMLSSGQGTHVLEGRKRILEEEGDGVR